MADDELPPDLPEMDPARLKWILIESAVLEGETILYIFDKRYLKEAREAHPDLVVYFPQEAEQLTRVKDSEFLKKIHAVKQAFRGWVVGVNQKKAPPTDPPPDTSKPSGKDAGAGD